VLRNYYINRDWILSVTARRIYVAAATMSLVLFFIFILLNLSEQNFIDPIPEGLLPLIRGLVLLGVLGTAITFVAMEYFLFSFDTSSALKKTVWFCAMMLPLLGPALYCLLVYARVDLLPKASPSLISIDAIEVRKTE
jgi:hypothetical protein